MFKIQTIKSRVPEAGKFEIYQKREGVSNFEKQVLIFLYYVQKRVDSAQEVSTLKILVKQSGLKVSHSKVPSSEFYTLFRIQVQD